MNPSAHLCEEKKSSEVCVHDLRVLVCRVFQCASADVHADIVHENVKLATKEARRLNEKGHAHGRQIADIALSDRRQRLLDQESTPYCAGERAAHDVGEAHRQTNAGRRRRQSRLTSPDLLQEPDDRRRASEI